MAKHPLVHSFEQDTIVVYGPNTWGAGHSLDEAKKNFRAQGGRLTDGYIVYTFGPEMKFEGVDMMGRTSWTYIDEKVAEAHPQPEKTYVYGKALHKADVEKSRG